MASSWKHILKWNCLNSWIWFEERSGFAVGSNTRLQEISWHDFETFSFETNFVHVSVGRSSRGSVIRCFTSSKEDERSFNCDIMDIQPAPPEEVKPTDPVCRRSPRLMAFRSSERFWQRGAPDVNSWLTPAGFCWDKKQTSPSPKSWTDSGSGEKVWPESWAADTMLFHHNHLNTRRLFILLWLRATPQGSTRFNVK